MDPLKSKVTYAALYSRLGIIGLSSVANLLIPDHDAGVFRWPTETPQDDRAPSVADWIVGALTDGLTRWDGQYFLHIADNGYSYENTLAFFPLYPAVVRIVAELIFWLQLEYGLISFSSALKLAAVLVNVAAFVAAALALYELSRKVLKDEYLAYKSALLFCVNPASIFFSAAYSESLHAAITFATMLKVEKGFTFKLGLYLAASSAVRSNGLITVGFVLYRSLKIVGRELAIHSRLVQLNQPDLSTTVANVLGDAVVPSVFSLVAVLTPFALFQWFAFTRFCGLTKQSLDLPEKAINYAIDNALRLPSGVPPLWCGLTAPLPYSHVQSDYWEVGFLRYYQFRKIPQFLLAAPVLALVFHQSWVFCAKHHRFFSSRLGLTYYGMDPNHVVPPFHLYVARGLPRECFVYVVHAVALGIFCLFFIHVEVSTRLLMSSCPVIYWWAAVLTMPSSRKNPVPLFVPGGSSSAGSTLAKVEKLYNLDPATSYGNVLVDERRKKQLSPLGLNLLNYFLLYATLGTVLFSNYLPWT